MTDSEVIEQRRQYKRKKKGGGEGKKFYLLFGIADVRILLVRRRRSLSEIFSYK